MNQFTLPSPAITTPSPAAVLGAKRNELERLEGLTYDAASHFAPSERANLSAAIQRLYEDIDCLEYELAS